MPRPNYWGYWHEGKLVFQQCPADYCCSSRSPCNVYNYCPGNRTVTLCGSCMNGFSVSILTGACSPNHKCGKHQWFWLVAILAAMAYVLWYTLKDDIFVLFISLSCKFMKNICSRSNKNIDGIPKELTSVKLKSFNKIDFKMTLSKSEESSDYEA